MFKTADVAKERETIGLQPSHIAYQVSMFWYSNINYGSDYSGAILIQTSIPSFWMSTCIVWTRIVMPGARQPPREANRGFRLCKHATFSQLTGLSLRPECTLTCTGVTRILCHRHYRHHSVITSHTNMPPFRPQRSTKNTCIFVLWWDKLRGSKSPEKAFCLLPGFLGCKWPLQGPSIPVMKHEFSILTDGMEPQL